MDKSFFLSRLGINVSVYGVQSTRATSASGAYANNTSFYTVMKAAGWARESTFRKFYNKPLSCNENLGNNLYPTVLLNKMLYFGLQLFHFHTALKSHVTS